MLSRTPLECFRTPRVNAFDASKVAIRSRLDGTAPLDTQNTKKPARIVTTQTGSKLKR